MKPLFTPSLTILAIAGLCLVSFAAFAEDLSNCDKIADLVRASVEKEPQKVLIVVEDAMVTNEGCAAEIVKAAILASQANADLIKQIVATATHVAPKKAALIAEAAASVSGAPMVTSSSNGKYAKSVQPVQPPIIEPESSGGDYNKAPADIRGVYLTAPSAGGGITKTETVIKKVEVIKERKIVVNHYIPCDCNPQSPSVATSN
jgi:hypothetical protein